MLFLDLRKGKNENKKYTSKIHGGYYTGCCFSWGVADLVFELETRAMEGVVWQGHSTILLALLQTTRHGHDMITLLLLLRGHIATTDREKQRFFLAVTPGFQKG